MTGQLTESNLTAAAAAVQRARNILKIERSLETVSGSLFDTIVVNEIGPAISLATRMLGDYSIAANAVHVAFEQARTEFDTYDGSESPRAWMLGYVAEEVLRRTSEQAAVANSGYTRDLDGNHVLASIDDLLQRDTEAVLGTLGPERRLAVILTDVLGMTDEAAAAISRVDATTIRQRAAVARSWIARHLSIAQSQSAPDGAVG